MRPVHKPVKLIYGHSCWGCLKSVVFVHALGWEWGGLVSSRGTAGESSLNGPNRSVNAGNLPIEVGCSRAKPYPSPLDIPLQQSSDSPPFI